MINRRTAVKSSTLAKPSLDEGVEEQEQEQESEKEYEQNTSRSKIPQKRD